MNILTIIELVLGAAESLETVFIHNPKSQQTAAIITNDANALLAALPAPKQTASA